MSFATILLEQVEPGIFILTVNRPKSLNALNTQTLTEIHTAVQRLRLNHEARVLLITGAGDKAFVAGADIVEMKSYNAVQGKALSELGTRAFSALETLPIPAIAVVNGYCLGGGCELAMSCDWIIASEQARFGQPEINLGITPGFGGTQRLTRLVGRAKALELLLTGRQISAHEAFAIGLVNQVYAAEALMDEALALARLIAGKAPIAVRHIKEAVQRGQDMDLGNGCALESQLFGLCFATEDQKEGMKAFVEKRSAQFRNR
ncbi:MAG: enoyl-CoA hydratase-related protein [Pseudomonadota bacterium]|nr:enoyl-CoA hydratase-related protein [Pseudomonadota bacterium]